MAQHPAQTSITDSKQVTLRAWVARLLIGAVTVVSLYAAFSFILAPEKFTYAYELSGAVGEALVRGTGVFFLMWSVPYLFAAFDPLRYRLGLFFALLVQLTGFAGDVFLLVVTPHELIMLRATLLRFIVSSVTGLAVLAVAYALIKDIPPSQHAKDPELNGDGNDG
jgi:hypothetical protein